MCKIVCEIDFTHYFTRSLQQKSFPLSAKIAYYFTHYFTHSGFYALRYMSAAKCKNILRARLNRALSSWAWVFLHRVLLTRIPSLARMCPYLLEVPFLGCFWRRAVDVSLNVEDLVMFASGTLLGVSWQGSVDICMGFPCGGVPHEDQTFKCRF